MVFRTFQATWPGAQAQSRDAKHVSRLRTSSPGLSRQGGTVCEYYSNCYCCVMSDGPPVPHISSCAPTLCRVCVSPLTPSTHTRVTSAAAPTLAATHQPGQAGQYQDNLLNISIFSIFCGMFFPAIREQSYDGIAACPPLIFR